MYIVRVCCRSFVGLKVDEGYHEVRKDNLLYACIHKSIKYVWHLQRNVHLMQLCALMEEVDECFKHFRLPKFYKVCMNLC